MSFRLRVVALVSLVAVIAIGATAYLTFTQTSKQASESAAVDRVTVELITNELTRYAQEHGTWEAVPRTVASLKERTGQRIKLTTDSGTVIADTDTMEGRTARAVVAYPILIDPRPTLRVTGLVYERPNFGDLTLGEVVRYRSGVRLAACLTRRGLGVVISTGMYGIPQYVASEDASRDYPDQVRQCAVFAQPEGPALDVRQEIATCEQSFRWAPQALALPESSEVDKKPVVQPPAGIASVTQAAITCLQLAFTSATADLAPEPMLVYLGAVDEPDRSLTPGPVILAAALVALLAVVGTVLVSRRVLRPIGALTAASGRLGEGDLSLRVPVRGRDELATLAHSFNRMADSLQRGEERQRRLVADVAHELRSPLANLRGYLEALKDGVIPASPELFASLHEESVLQQRIVDDLQDLALAEAGALAYHRAEVDLAELLETCRTAAQTAAEAAGVTVLVHASDPVNVTADPDRLRQVIGNLITNALRATPAGGRIVLRATNSAPTIEVSDTGHGISPTDLPHIFDRFYRADPARARATGGSGLGLAIARQIITDHDGTITAASTPGAGTTITITLPDEPGS